MRYFNLFGVIAMIGMPLMTSAGPTPPPGFCSGATAPSADVFESDNDLQNAKYITALLDTGMPHNFDQDTDVDWSFFLGKIAGQGATQRLFYAVQALNIGPGIQMIVENFDPPSGQGSGIVIDVFNDDGSQLIATSDISGCDEGTSAQTEDFEVPQEGVYRIRVSQCRLSVAELQNFCIGTDPSYQLRIISPTGFGPGLLQGVVTDSSSGAGVGFALIESDDINNATLSLPETDNNVSGFYSMADTIDRDGTGFLGQVTAEGYEQANIQFELVADQVTPCDIQLTPTGQVFRDGFETKPGPFSKGPASPCTQF